MIKNALVLLVLVVALAASTASSAPTSQNGDNESPARLADSLEATTSSSSGSEMTTEPENKPKSSTEKEAIDTTTPGELFDFTSYKNTSTFTCNGRVTGYYADVRLNCRVYHFCTQLDGIEGPSYQRMSYICLENSFFDQKDLNCVKKADLKVTCDRAEAEYERSNKQFDPKEESQPSMSDNLAANIMMNPLTRFIAGR